MKVPVDEEHAGQRDPYTQAGVDADRQERALGGLLAHIGRLSSKRQLLPIGLFANVLDLGHGFGDKLLGADLDHRAQVRFLA